jgi:hypothetical protein
VLPLAFMVFRRRTLNLQLKIFDDFPEIYGTILQKQRK